MSAILKQMDNKEDPYVHFHESEWRVIWSPEIEEYLRSKGERIEGLFRKPEDVPGFNKFLQENDIPTPPRYLMPLVDNSDGLSKWLHLIIYPDIAMKTMASWNAEIRNALMKLKPKPKDQKWQSEKTADWEQYAPAIELDLDSCRNF